MRLLSVDWDFFFPVPDLNDSPDWALYDWSHRDGGAIFTDLLWYHRAKGFLMAGRELPMTSGEEINFWDRFTFSPHARLYFADSHVQIFHPRTRKNITEIVNFDAHHDAGYHGTARKLIDRGTVTCEDWAAILQLSGTEVTTVYPRWRSWAMEREPKPLAPISRKVDQGENLGRFDRVFICRSGGWTPPWLDGSFEAFLAACPVKRRYSLDTVSNRQWSPEQVAYELGFLVDSLAHLGDSSTQEKIKNAKIAIQRIQGQHASKTD